MPYMLQAEGKGERWIEAVTYQNGVESSRLPYLFDYARKRQHYKQEYLINTQLG